jgi:sigma-B regulation protein RsbU (phosphoserine phosphatase)
MINPATIAQSFDSLDHVLRIEELFLLQRVAQKINSILDLETLLDEIVGDVASTFGYTRLAVLLKDEQNLELVIGAGWTGELCLKGTRFKIGKDGMGGHAAATGETHYAPDVRKNPFYIAGEEDTRSEIDIPLKIRGELIGVFNVQHTETNAFSPERIRLLEALAGHVATAIANARMFQRERLEKDRMIKELDEARGIQFGLFPGNCPDIPGFEITGVCQPCREVGGDWYDYIPLPDGRFAVVLADVSGKGMGAALLMSSTRSILRLYAANGLSPSEVLTSVNSLLVNDFPSAKFVTMVYAVIDPVKRTVSFANAGHLQPILVDENGAQLLETDAGMPLGIMDNRYSEREIEMPAGSRLFLYTDGVTEANNSALDEYGSERTLAHVAGASSSVQTLLNDVDKFTAGFPATDDVTVVMLASGQNRER